jgi:hypothetical protein
MSIINFDKVKNTKLKYFSYYLIYVLSSEIFADFMIIIYKQKPFYVYNFYTIMTVLFYFIFYKQLFQKPINKKIMNVFFVIFLLFTIVEFTIFKTSFLNSFSTYNFILGAILLIITVILFLIEIINNEDIIFKIKKALVFWISIGVLLFYVGSLPIFITGEFLGYKGIFDKILIGLNIIMYGSFILGFLWSDKKYIY